MSAVAHAPGHADAHAGIRQYCTFWVDGLFFGLDVEWVQEVLRYQQMTVVPCAPESVLGLINLRGQIVTALDLRCRLGLPPRADGVLPMNVIVRSRGEVVSLLVDDIGEVIDTDARDLQPTPANLPTTVQDAVLGVMPLAGAILLVLDADRAVDVSTLADSTGGTP
ncbi:chemotaxis protein CheW [Nocardioides sp. TRM66260-LWL]|uniref:chemotaxis protein CheW n=1 Tax=Nocardioides sp. TRM66260-LWL TaxID=2874478 RepID=UPI001CC7E1A5|nr:chemotaxis protein CheW [Nocardioides sp. TRM66260-LWL]MBZ5736159.1 chemotaxis protein CheW [Nocardioides sp. TRM66260-LWL]